MRKYRLTFTANEISKAAKEFLKINEKYRHFSFYGSMGVGKTTFIKALCKQLGTIDLVSSPSFAIINEYITYQGNAVYHFDFYRIHTSTELLDIGFNEYCSPDTYAFIEWPEKAEEIIPDDFVQVLLEEDSEGTRTLIFSH
jgi:tRNA threonylcarbamoyladenosine biosynthesis protein TsaE